MAKTKTRKKSGNLRQEIARLKTRVEKMIIKEAAPKKRLEKIRRGNPMKHFPPLPGRGRPEKVRKIEMTTKMADGRAYQKTLTATKSKAYAQAKRVLEKGIKGKPVASIMVEDIAVVRGGKKRKR